MMKFSRHTGSTDSIVTGKHRLTDRYKYSKTDTIKRIQEVVYALSIGTEIDDLEVL